jgi:hypothetical protein
VYIIYLIVDLIFCINFVYEFTVNFEKFYYILQLYANIFFLCIPMVAVSMGRHVTVDIFHNISCIDCL